MTSHFTWFHFCPRGRVEVGGAGLILALEGRTAAEQDEEQAEEVEEQEQNVPPPTAVPSVGTEVPPPGSRDVVVDTGNVGIWEGSSG